jgi:carboxypeptidase C (cathepsin A)
MKSLVLCGLVFATTAAGVRCQDTGPKPPPKAEPKADSFQEHLSETQHAITLDGTKFDYKATAGNLVLKDEAGKATASMFFIAYTKPGADLRKRPVTFTFNGGPGSSSVWLHLGAFGPLRVPVGDVGESVAPPYRLVENESSLLDLTDLVFIDPVTTGYSRPAPGQDPKQFHGVQEDIQSVGEFIRLYVTRYQRWPSPKFLAGESYGTTRAAGLVGYLQDRYGMDFNGVVLVSSVLIFETIRFDDGNDLPYILYLPSYTATAWFHKKLSAELQADLHRTLAEVEQFALGDYTLALMKGSKLSPEARKEVAQKLARYTGLSGDYVARSNLRMDSMRFMKELLRGEHRTVGRYDSRFTGTDLDAVGEQSEYDPSFAAVQGPYTATLNSYVRTELKYERDFPYEILTGRVQPWNFGNARNRYLNVSGSLRQAMAKNRDLRVFVANGYYDLATPYLATDYTFNHLGLDSSHADRVMMGYYEAGHMMYIHKPSLQKLKKDLAGFIRSALHL